MKSKSVKKILVPPGGGAGILHGGEPKFGFARDLGDCLQSRNVLFGTSGDYHYGKIERYYRECAKTQYPVNPVFVLTVDGEEL